MTTDERIADLERNLKQTYAVLAALVQQAGGEVRIPHTTLIELPQHPTLETSEEDMCFVIRMKL